MIHDIYAQLAESFVATILEAAGYRVQRFGVEHVVPELKSVQVGHRRHLTLPARLASLPDLLVMDLEKLDSRLVEVKFRKSLTDPVARQLQRAMTTLLQDWPDAWMVIITMDPPVSTGRYQDHIRVIRPESVIRFGSEDALEQRWKRLPTLGASFPRTHDHPEYHADVDRAFAAFGSWVAEGGDK